MIDAAIAANILAWGLQVSIITAVAAALPLLLRIEAPVVRYAWWRAVLAVCLVLPFVQSWQVAPPVVSDDLLPSTAVVAGASASRTIEPRPPAPVLHRAPAPWPAAIGVVLLAGALLRLAWLGAGVWRLRRLRRAGERAAPSEGHDELKALTEAGAEIRYVPALGQPVTFGVLRPVVLLPASLSSLPGPVQRAVLAHELWHVRRRDWVWSLAEESIRAILWFHPAIWYIVSRVQSSREEVVDELTVLLTNARRSYLEALLAFADERPLFPAAPFARRRHLYQRMLLISKEAVMSSRRIVASSAAMIAGVLLTGWYGAAAFPLTATAPEDLSGANAIEARAGQSAQAPPRDPRPGQPRPPTSQEGELNTAIAAAPTASPALYLELAKLQEARGAFHEVETTLLDARRAFPDNAAVVSALTGFYARSGQFEKAVALLEDIAAANPGDPKAHQMVATFYQEKVSRDQTLSSAERLRHVQAGIGATDRALAADPDYVEALTCKNIFLRMQANLETDPATRQHLIAEADTLRNRAMELSKARSMGAVGVRQPGAAPPPPPPPSPPSPLATEVDGQTPLRVGGDVKPPTKVRDVRPVYPQEALDAMVTGVVILEAVIDGTGLVRDARVLRSIPMLDEAALEAVRQWEFTPTLVDGAPVPVVMTVTVNFTMQ